jgi:hypothetical protein
MADIERTALALWRRVYRRCAEIARAEVVGTFGQAFQGGKWQWPHLLPGHGYELTQAAYGYDATHAVITVAAGATTATQHVAFDTARPYVSGSTPVVLVSSGDGNWLASWSNVDDTGFDLTVTAIPATVSGEQDVAIAGGSNSGTQAISFGVTFTAAPVVEVEVVDDPAALNAEGDYQPSIQGRSTTGFTARLVHLPVDNAVQTSDNATLTTGMSSPPVLTGGVNGSPVTGLQDHDHVHDTSGGHGTLTTIQQADGAIPSTLANHAHGLALPGSDHTHNTGDHTHSLNNHHHTVNMFPNEGSTRHLTVGWVATGIVTAAGGDVPVSWLAIGVQSS